jgi:hypothetical protein
MTSSPDHLRLVLETTLVNILQLILHEFCFSGMAVVVTQQEEDGMTGAEPSHNIS